MTKTLSNTMSERILFYGNCLSFFSNRIYRCTAVIILLLLNTQLIQSQTPYVMSGGNYSELFTNIANTTNWPNNFNGTDCTEWASVPLNATGTLGDGVKVTVSSATFTSGTTGGIQRGTTNLYMLSTSTNNSCAVDLLLDFTGRTAGTVSFDAATVFNSAGNRNSILKLFYSTNGSTFTELTGTNLPYTASNNVTSSASITAIALPAAFNNSSTARLRFYEYSTTAGAGTPTGSQPKISVDNISVTSAAMGNNTFAAYSSQLSGSITKGINNAPIAGFTFTPGATTDFTGVTVTGANATSADISNVRIFRDVNGNGAIDGADASVSGSGISFGTSMIFTITGESGLNAIRSYLIAGDIAFAATAASVQVSISSGNYTTSSGTNSGSMAAVTRTLVSPPGTTIVSAGPGTEPASISSLINSQAASVLNFDVTIQDDGSTPATDEVDSKISQMVFSQGTGNDIADWTLAIAGAELSDGTNTQTGTVSAAAITFAAINTATLGLITDNTSKTYTLKVWLKPDLTTLKTTIDGANIVFRLQGTNITADNTGSQLAGGQDQNSGASSNAIEVTATGLAYVQNSNNVAVNTAMSPSVTVAATDANGNRDLGFIGSITISSTGTLSGTSANTVSAVNGLATFSNIIHSVAQTARTLNAERSSPDFDWDISSAAFDVQAVTVDYTAQGSSYTQNFDGLSSTAATQTWSNGTTPFQGWFAIAPLLTPTSILGVQTGTGSSAAIANFGPSANTNRSIGWIYANTLGAAGTLASIGFGITNSTGNTITEYTLSYLGRQWRTNTTTPGTLVVEYKIGGSFDNNSSGWTAAPASLTFTGPNTTGAAAIDGYAAGNTASLTATVTGISWTAGSTIWIRWRDTNDPNTDAQLAIDNVNFSTPAISNTDLSPYASQLSANLIRGNVNVPLAGFTITPTTALNFTGVTVTGSLATLTDITNVRIFKDNNGNGAIDGADASVSGAGNAFAASMPFSLAEAQTANVAASYLVVGDIAFNGTSADVTIGIPSSSNFSTSTGTKSGSVPDVTRTFESPAGTSTITAGPATEPISLSSLINTQGAAVLNFDFTINDDGATPATDLEPTDIFSMIVTQGTGNDVSDWTQVIAGAEISDGATTATGTISASGLSFDMSGFPGGASSVPDDGSKTYSVRVWLKPNLGNLKTTIDGSNLVFRIVPASIDFGGSQFAAGQDENSGAANNAIDVTATGLAYVQNASNAGVGTAMTPAVTVSANDANGNRDLDFTEQIRITSTGTLTGSPVNTAALAGLATFSTLTHGASGNSLTLNAERTNTLDWDITSATFDISQVTSASDFFRSNVAAGNWGTAGSWQSSPDSVNWITSTMIPNSSAKTILIRSGNNITIAAAVTVDQVVISSGGTLTQTSAFTVANGSGDDVIVENGGTMVYSLAGTPPTYTSSTIRINSGGVLSARASGITAAGAGVNAATHIYDDGSILEWNVTGGTPSASGVTFFPNANAATVPVFRFATSVASAGGTGNTAVNGKLELATGVTLGFTGSGTKTFRNGIRGAGTLTQGTSGQFIINGATAELGGGTLTLGMGGLAVSSGTTLTLSSGKTIGGAGTITNAGVIVLNGFTLTSGSIAGTGTISGSATSSMVLNAASTLRFTTGAQTLKNLNINAGTSTLSTALDITAGAAMNTSGTVTVASGAVLASGGNLTIKSNVFGTARVAAGDNTQYITGDVTIERYIPNNGFRSWRLLSVPTSGAQTIKASWQEGNAALENNKLNYGTQITGLGGTGAGFDAAASSASILSWNGTGWANVTSTLGAISADVNKAYFVFVRGERSKGVAGTNSNTSATTLETKGTIYTGEQTRTIANPSSFGLIPNLYPSAINFTALTRTNVDNVFYIWNSKFANGTSTGQYQTFSGTNSYAPVPAGGGYGVSNTTIESGQAFLVRTDATPGGGSVVMHENSKISSSPGSLGLRPATPASLVKIDTRLQIIKANGNITIDGNAVVFDNAYSAAVDGQDALKLSNPAENFAIQTSDKSLAVEGRPVINAEDVIYFKMWNMKQQDYQFEFIPSNLSSDGLTAELVDSYLRTSSPVSLEANTIIGFTVDANAASSATDRFRILFKKAEMPVSVLKQSFAISPNPAEGSVLTMQFINQVPGKYGIRVINTAGQLISRTVINHTVVNRTEQLQLVSGTAAGAYQVQIIAPGGGITAQKLMIK